MKYTKSNDSKEKEVKKYRLQSILKLHNKIHNENLKVVAAKGLSLYRLTASKQTASLEIINHKLNEMLNLLADCGMHHEAVMLKSKDLQLASEQEKLKELFALVTSFNLETKSKDSKSCSCGSNNHSQTVSGIKYTSESLGQGNRVFTAEVSATSLEEAVNQVLKDIKEGKIK